MELVKHECGVAMVRLLKPLEYYKEKYGTAAYGLDLLYLLMEKQHNRGQEAAGLGAVRLNTEPGREYLFRQRAEGSGAIQEIFEKAHKEIAEARAEGLPLEDCPYIGEVYMGHLRYSTTGRSGLSYVHPFMRRNNWQSRNLLLCGNFNLTNVDELFEQITATGQHPRLYGDTFLLLEQLGHALDRENERLFGEHHSAGMRGLSLAGAIARELNVANVLRRCSPTWDGGYVICGIVGNGDLWAMRDPNGIRPAFYYINDEVMVVASERPVIQTALGLNTSDVCELRPGSALIVDRDGTPRIEQILPEGPNRKCSFERIYFSRGSDEDIYRERKNLGRNLVDKVLRAVDNEVNRLVLSFIPNTAEAAFFGMVEGFEDHVIKDKIREIQELAETGEIHPRAVEEILRRRVRREKVAIKDIKLRTFIAEGASRNNMAAHVYDVTYGTVRPGEDNLVAIDDSIVRGTTLRQSILRILDRLHPKRIVIVSSSPQVRYPDCYGIDMSRMGEFIAFRAAIELLRERGMQNVIDEVYALCKTQEELPKERIVNYVKRIYEPFTDEEISAQIARMLTPDDVKAEVKIVYQDLEGMHEAIPDHHGDWYFSGDYPTPGGNRIVNQAFINFYEGKIDKR
ncbi:MAG: amidophosphoribosyltransferase [Muribaculaceae bacterium]|nr:amidophosphoribosyltransferase [Muribaculaceae bacterium]